MIPAAEYARRVGVAKSRMTVWLADGLPFTEGVNARNQPCKLVDPAQADAWRAANVSPRLDGAGQLRGVVSAPSTSPGQGGPPTPETPAPNAAVERIQSSKAASSELELEMRRTRLDTQRGRLVDREAAMDAARGFAGAVRTAIERMAADSAAVLAAELGVTEHQAYTSLKRVAQRMEEDLARTSRAHGERIAAAGRG